MKKLKLVSNILTILTGYSLLILSFGIVLEIFLRAVFNFSLQGVDEYGGYVVAILVAFGISQNLLLRGHIRIDFFFDKLSFTVQAYLNLLTYFLFFVITSTIVFFHAVKAFLKNKPLFNQEFGPPSIAQKVIKKDYD